MVPLSEVMFQRTLDHGNAEKTMTIKVFETVVQQVWSTLPGYCDLPLDVPAAVDQPFAELLSNLLYKQPELRVDVCRGLQNLVESNQAVLASPKSYGWIRVEGDSDRVTGLSIKVPISDTPMRDHAVVGAFWFRHGRLFVEAAEQMIADGDRIRICGHEFTFEIRP